MYSRNGFEHRRRVHQLGVGAHEKRMRAPVKDPARDRGVPRGRAPQVVRCRCGMSREQAGPEENDTENEVQAECDENRMSDGLNSPGPNQQSGAKAGARLAT